MLCIRTRLSVVPIDSVVLLFCRSDRPRHHRMRYLHLLSMRKQVIVNPPSEDRRLHGAVIAAGIAQHFVGRFACGNLNASSRHNAGNWVAQQDIRMAGKGIGPPDCAGSPEVISRNALPPAGVVLDGGFAALEAVEFEAADAAPPAVICDVDTDDALASNGAALAAARVSRLHVALSGAKVKPR